MASSGPLRGSKRLASSAARNAPVVNSLLNSRDDGGEKCESSSHSECRFESRQTDDRLNRSSDYHDARLNNLDLNNWRSSASVDGSCRVKKRNQEREMERKGNANQRLDITHDDWSTTRGQIPSKRQSIGGSPSSVCGSSSNAALSLNSRRQTGSAICEADCNYLVTRLMKLRECIREATKAAEKYSKRLDLSGLQQFGQLSGLVKRLKEEEDLCLTSLQKSLVSREMNISKQEREARLDIDRDSDMDNSSRQEQDQDLDPEINSSMSETELQFGDDKRTNRYVDLHSQQRSAFDKMLLNQQEELLRTEADIRSLVQNDGQQRRNDRTVRSSSLGVSKERSGCFQLLEDLRGSDEDDTGPTMLKSRYVHNLHETKNKIPDQVRPSRDLNRPGLAVLGPLETQRLEKLNEKNKQLQNVIRKLHSLQQERLLLKNELASNVSDIWGNVPDFNSTFTLGQLLHGYGEEALAATECNADVAKMFSGRTEDALEVDEEYLRERRDEGVTGDAVSVSELSTVGTDENKWSLLMTSDPATLAPEMMASEVHATADKSCKLTEEGEYLKHSFQDQVEGKWKSSEGVSDAKQRLETQPDDLEQTGLQEKLSQLKQAKDMMANLTRLLAFAELPSGMADDQTRARWRPSSAILPNYSERNDQSCENILHKVCQEESEFAQLLEESKYICEQQEELRKLQNAIDKDEEGTADCTKSVLDESAELTTNSRNSFSLFSMPSVMNHCLLPPRASSECTETKVKNTFGTAVSSESVFDHTRKQQKEMHKRELQQKSGNKSFKLKTQNHSTHSKSYSYIGDLHRLNPAMDLAHAAQSGNSESTDAMDASVGLQKHYFSKLTDSNQNSDTIPFSEVDKESKMSLSVFDDPTSFNPTEAVDKALFHPIDKEGAETTVENLAWDVVIGSEVSANECRDHHSVQPKRTSAEDGNESEFRVGDLSVLCKDIESLKKMLGAVVLSLREKASLGEEHQLQKNQLFIGLNQCLFQLLANQNSMTERLNQLEKAVYRFGCGNAAPLEQPQRSENSIVGLSNKCESDSPQRLKLPVPGRKKLNNTESSKAEQEFQENQCSGKPNAHSLRRGKHLVRNHSSRPSLLLSSPHQNEHGSGNVLIKTIEATNSGLVDRETHNVQAVCRQGGLDSGGGLASGKPKSGLFMGSCVPRRVKTSSLNVTSDSYDEFVSSGSTSGVARRQRLMGDDHRAERLECHEVDPLSCAKHGRTSFEFLKETIYSEVATLVTLNEHCPHYLIRLFQELQLLSSDLLRQKALHAIQDINAKDLSTSVKQAVDPIDECQNRNLNLESMWDNSLDAKFVYLEGAETSSSDSASKSSSCGHETCHKTFVNPNNVIIDSFTSTCRERNFESDSLKSDESAVCDDEGLAMKQAIKDMDRQMCDVDLRPGKGHSMTSDDKWTLSEVDPFAGTNAGSGNFRRTAEETQTENCPQDSDD